MSVIVKADSAENQPCSSVLLWSATKHVLVHLSIQTVVGKGMKTISSTLKRWFQISNIFVVSQCGYSS